MPPAGAWRGGRTRSSPGQRGAAGAAAPQPLHLTPGSPPGSGCAAACVGAAGTRACGVVGHAVQLGGQHHAHTAQHTTHPHPASPCGTRTCSSAPGSRHQGRPPWPPRAPDPAPLDPQAHAAPGLAVQTPRRGPPARDAGRATPARGWVGGWWKDQKHLQLQGRECGGRGYPCATLPRAPQPTSQAPRGTLLPRQPRTSAPGREGEGGSRAVSGAAGAAPLLSPPAPAP